MHRLFSSAAVVTSGLLGAVGCGPEARDADENTTSGPLYAIMYEVYDDVGATSYLSLLDSIEIDAVDVTKAGEYTGGRAFIQAYGGKLFVGDAATPTRISVTIVRSCPFSTTSVRASTPKPIPGPTWGA